MADRGLKADLNLKLYISNSSLKISNPKILRVKHPSFLGGFPFRGRFWAPSSTEYYLC